MGCDKGNELTVVATGDTMVARKLSVFSDPEFLSIIKVIQNADVAFTNCEILFHNNGLTRIKI